MKTSLDVLLRMAKSWEESSTHLWERKWLYNGILVGSSKTGLYTIRPRLQKHTERSKHNSVHMILFVSITRKTNK